MPPHHPAHSGKSCLAGILRHQGSILLQKRFANVLKPSQQKAVHHVSFNYCHSCFINTPQKMPLSTLKLQLLKSLF